MSTVGHGCRAGYIAKVTKAIAKARIKDGPKRNYFLVNIFFYVYIQLDI